MNRAGLAAGAAFLLGVQAVAGDLEVELGNGDSVRGALERSGEFETFRIACPAGSSIDVVQTAGFFGSEAVVRVFSPSSETLAQGSGRKFSLRNVPAAASGVYRVVVAALPGGVDPDYSIHIKWKSPKSVSLTLPVGAGSTATFDVPAEAAAKVALKVVRGKHSKSSPVLDSVRCADAQTDDLGAVSKATWSPRATGTQVVQVTNAGETGDVKFTARIRPPKATNRRLSAMPKEIPAGTSFVAARVVDRVGGTLTAPAGTYAGVKIEVPTGALKRPAIVWLATAADLTPVKPYKSRKASAALLTGPVNAVFSKYTPKLTIPYAAPTAPGADVARMTAYRSRVPVGVEVVSTADASQAAGTIAMDVSKFGAYQVWRVIPDSLTPKTVLESDGRAGDVVVRGNWAFVCRPLAAGPGDLSNTGAVQTFERVAGVWTERAPLVAPDPADGDAFGTAVGYRPGTSADEEDTLLVSAPNRANGADLRDGAIYEFVRNATTWTHRATLTSPDPSAADAFGGFLSLSGNRAVTIGGRDVLVSTAFPPAFVLKWTPAGWQNEATVDLAADGVAGVTSVAVHGATFVVGTADIASLGTGRKIGSAYVYDGSGGTFAQALHFDAHDVSLQVEDRFGRAAAVSPDLLAVHGYDDPTGSGDVYVRRLVGGQWTAETILAGPPDDSSAAHGARVAISGTRIAAGLGNPAGAWVHRFADGAWDREFTLGDSGYDVPRGWVYTGASADFDGTTVVVAGNVVQSSSGAAKHRVQFFQLPPE